MCVDVSMCDREGVGGTRARDNKLCLKPEFPLR